MIWRTGRARNILLTDSFSCSLGGDSVQYAKLGGMQRARADFSRLVKEHNVNEFYNIRGGKWMY